MKAEFNPDAYWENRLHKIKGLEGVGYKKLGPGFNYWAYKVRKKVFLSEVQKIASINPLLQVVDIGSGTGFYIQAWKELGVNNITGVDISNTSVQNLKDTFGQFHFFQSDIGAENFNELNNYDKYDLVSSMDVLFHIVDDSRFEQAIKNISSILKSGGYFIYSDNFLKNRKVFRGESQTVRTEAYLNDVFKKNNFEVVATKPFMYLTNNPIDSKNPILKLYWWLLENTLYVLPFLGNVFGALIYPLEMVLVRKASWSPTTKFVIFRKK